MITYYNEINIPKQLSDGERMYCRGPDFACRQVHIGTMMENIKSLVFHCVSRSLFQWFIQSALSTSKLTQWNGRSWCWALKIWPTISFQGISEQSNSLTEDMCHTVCLISLPHSLHYLDLSQLSITLCIYVLNFPSFLFFSCCSILNFLVSNNFNKCQSTGDSKIIISF